VQHIEDSKITCFTKAVLPCNLYCPKVVISEYTAGTHKTTENRKTNFDLVIPPGYFFIPPAYFFGDSASLFSLDVIL